MAILEVQNIRKSFGSILVLDDISFTMEKGSVLSLIGSSGSGKTTLLRCLNFLEKPDAGIIRVKAQDQRTGRLFPFKLLNQSADTRPADCNRLKAARGHNRDRINRGFTDKDHHDPE